LAVEVRDGDGVRESFGGELVLEGLDFQLVPERVVGMRGAHFFYPAFGL
jgi:hypothetical protein